MESFPKLTGVTITNTYPTTLKFLTTNINKSPSRWITSKLNPDFLPDKIQPRNQPSWSNPEWKIQYWSVILRCWKSKGTVETMTYWWTDEINDLRKTCQKTKKWSKITTAREGRVTKAEEVVSSNVEAKPQTKK